MGHLLITYAWIIPWCVFCVFMNGYSRRHPNVGLWWYGGFAVADTVLAGWFFVHGPLWLAGMFVFYALLEAWLWWDCWNRRRKSRAMALVGAKSKALVDGLVARQKEVTVERPVPGLQQN